MTVIQAFWQGMLQGLTEFLPVSSSGHLSLFQYLTGQSGESAFAFSILLHAGTLVAVCICFFPTLAGLVQEAFFLLGDLFTGRIRKNPMTGQRRTLLFLLLSTLPLGLLLVLKDIVEQFSTDRDITVEGFCFLITSLLLLTAAGRRGHKDGERITAGNALAVGCAQVLATMPGISRSGATISTGLLCGFSREYAVSYSFTLGIPAVLGATLLECKDLLAGGSDLQLPLSVALTGFVSAVVFGILSIKLVQWLIKGDKFRWFGYYTLVLGIVVLAVGFYDRFAGYPVQQFFSAL